MSNYIKYRKQKFKKMFFFTTPTKKENESTNTTPKTEINESPYDYQKQLDFDLYKITETKGKRTKKKTI